MRIKEMFATVKIDDLPKIKREGNLSSQDINVKRIALSAVFPLWLEGKEFKDNCRLYLEKINEALPENVNFPVNGLRSLSATFVRRFDVAYRSWCRDLPIDLSIPFNSGCGTPLRPLIAKEASSNPMLNVSEDDNIVSEILSLIQEKVREEDKDKITKKEVVDLFNRLRQTLEFDRIQSSGIGNVDCFTSLSSGRTIVLQDYLVRPIRDTIDNLFEKLDQSANIDSLVSELKGQLKLIQSVLVSDSKELEFLDKFRRNQKAESPVDLLSVLREIELSPKSFTDLVVRGVLEVENSEYQGVLIYSLNELFSLILEILEDEEIEPSKLKKLHEILSIESVEN